MARENFIKILRDGWCNIIVLKSHASLRIRVMMERTASMRKQDVLLISFVETA
jgi:hypothetical protein